MESTKEKGFEGEDLIRELMELVFEKAARDSKKKPVHGLANYLSIRFMEDFQFNIDVNTFSRYYKGYISGEGKKQNPTEDVLKALCRYLGFEDFKDFEIKSKCEIAIRRLRAEILRNKKNQKKWLVIYLSAITLLAGGLIFLMSKYYEKNCMIWVEDHYEKVRCSGKASQTELNMISLNRFRQITPCDTTTFFKNGNPALWYDKSNNNLTYFTYPGKHPINGKALKDITQDIIDVHLNSLRNCDSIN